jgi:WD40 repeat protein
VQTFHWHSQKVSTLLFVPDTPYLLSAGVEAVIVQWHLVTQNKNFISRVGNAITNLALSYPAQTYFSASLDDNSVKVIRFDNLCKE